MAITPERAIDAGKNRFLQQVRKLEAEIDAILERDAFRGRPVEVRELYAPDHFVRNELVRRYRDAGWIIELRLNTYYFSPAPSKVEEVA